MRKIYAFLGLGFVTSLGFQGAYGQTTIDAEFRPRAEFRQGFKKPLADTLDPPYIILQRTRLNADYKGKILNARVSLQDSRVWGNGDNKVNSSKVELYEGWFEYLPASGFSIQAGRQQLKYDDQRLLAAPNWSNTGTTHDALVLKYNSPFIQVHAGGAYNNSKDTLMQVAYAYTAKQNYKALGYLWLSKPIYKGLNLSLIGVCDGFEKTYTSDERVYSVKVLKKKVAIDSSTFVSKTDYKTVYPRITFGGNLVFVNDSCPLAATLTGYLQKGKDPNKKDGKSMADLNAFFFAARVSYKVTSLFTPMAGLDYYSGSKSDIDANKSTTFNRLYGATHSFNGSMEYFATLPTQGLKDFYAGLNSKIGKKFAVDVTGHWFYFDKTFVYKKVENSNDLGSELDVTLSYTVSKDIAFQAGYSSYFNTGTTNKYLKQEGVKVAQPQWAFLMVTIKPQLYKTPPVADK